MLGVGVWWHGLTSCSNDNLFPCKIAFFFKRVSPTWSKWTTSHQVQTNFCVECIRSQISSSLPFFFSWQLWLLVSLQCLFSVIVCVFVSLPHTQKKIWNGHWKRLIKLEQNSCWSTALLHQSLMNTSCELVLISSNKARISLYERNFVERLPLLFWSFVSLSLSVTMSDPFSQTSLTFLRFPWDRFIDRVINDGSMCVVVVVCNFSHNIKIFCK